MVAVSKMSAQDRGGLMAMEKIWQWEKNSNFGATGISPIQVVVVVICLVLVVIP